LPDLAVLVPSRGRPEKVARLIEACKKTCRADTELFFGFDFDDPQLQDSIMASDGARVMTGTRLGLAGWTNRLSQIYECNTPYLASVGDDMVPVTDGWDERLIAACGTTGMAYPNDGRRTDIPELIVMSSDIVRALGWMCLPTLEHWYVDNVWSDLGRGAGCLSFLADVVVEHRHPNVVGGDRPDATYNDAAGQYAADLAAYQRWRLAGMRQDIATVKGLL
jgi:hypothetical protein